MRAEQSGDEIKLTDSFLFKESIKEITGRHYDPEYKVWYVPNTSANIMLLRMLGAEFDESFVIADTETVPQVMDELPVAVMPIKATPYKHQIAAFNFALKLFGGAA